MDSRENKDYCTLFMPDSGKLLSRDDVNVELSTCHNRIVTNNNVLESSIEAIWNKERQDNPKVFNGTKFRYAGHECYENGSYIMLKIGVTDYKTYLGTNTSEYAMQYFELGISDYGDYNVHLSNSLGVGAIVETNNEHIILIKRSQTVSEAKGMIGLPAGHAEPMNIVGKIPATEIIIEQLNPKDVVNELFNSILFETRDEINIPLAQLNDPLLMGINGNKKHAYKPTAEFYIRSSLSSDEIIKLYNKGTQIEADETIGIIAIPISDLSHITDKEIYSTLTPSAKGAIELYLKVIEGRP